ncbi:MAG: hypothetical protein FJ385_02715 [Verrucomicrobia bacterium]|nr:hypothetical protein [Verrucomicrobiota bacterium]
MIARTFCLCASLAWLASSLHAAETRVWMSRKGGLLEAKLGSFEKDSVTLVKPDNQIVTLKAEELCLADRQYLVDLGEAPKSLITGGKADLVEKDYKPDKKSFQELEEKLTFSNPDAGSYTQLETPHFIVASVGRIRPHAVAETAERMWYGMAFEHMGFRKHWGDKRMLILLVGDETAHQGLCEYSISLIEGEEGRGSADESFNAEIYRTRWKRNGTNSLYLPDDLTAARKLQPVALVFNTTGDDEFKQPLSPYVVHVLAGRLLGNYMGYVSDYADQGYFAILTGHKYYKEIGLAGKSETNLLSVESTGQDVISSKSGFRDGSSWAKTLRELVRKGQVEPKLGPMLRWRLDELDPEKLVTIYSFSHYMQSDNQRLSAYSKLIRRIETSNQVPPPAEIAKIFGFDTVEQLETDWTTFIKEGDFK